MESSSKRQIYLYVSRFFSGFAGWLTFLAIALLVKEKYGAHQVAWTFIIQSIPPVIFSQYLAKKIEESKMLRFYNYFQAITVIALVILSIYLNLTSIYMYLLVNSVALTVTNPLLITMATKSFSADEWKGIHIRLNSIQAATLAIAPVFGGWFSSMFGFQNLIYLILFCIGLSLLFINKSLIRIETITNKNLENNQSGFLYNLLNLKINNNELRKYIAIWTLFLCCGALLNVIEFEIFSKFNFSRSDIGWVIGSWGIGNLLAFLSSYLRKQIVRDFWSVVGLVLVLVSFLYMSHVVGSAILFLFAGYFNSQFSGFIRSKISESIPKDERSLDVWSAINQRMGIVNIIFYGLGGYLLQKNFRPQLEIVFVLFWLMLLGFVWMKLKKYHWVTK